MAHTQLQVQGMTCGGCSGRLKRVLQACEGISKAEADHLKQHVKVDYDPARIDLSRIRAAIGGAGFTVSGESASSI